MYVSGKVQLTGSKVLEETVINAQSVAANGEVNFNISPTDEDEIWIAVSIDKQPWSLSTSHQFYTGADGSSGSIFPKRINQSTTHHVNSPAVSLYLGGFNLSASWGLIEPATIDEAKGYMIPYKMDAKGRVRNGSSEIATVTVRLIRVWKKGGN